MHGAAYKGPYFGIVQSKLDDNGFPLLNGDKLDAENNEWINSAGSAYDGGSVGNMENGYAYDMNESLAYLFDPDYETNYPQGAEKYSYSLQYRKSYEDVKGLFQLNDEGYYYYDCGENYAEFDEANNKFNLHNTWGGYWQGIQGQFFPFTSADNVWLWVDTDYSDLQSTPANHSNFNHFFGLTFESDFMMPNNGQIMAGGETNDMVFEFSGDDDVWIFIDGVLVADLGGNHDRSELSINFRTGEVQTTGYNLAGAKETHTIYDSFIEAYESPEALAEIAISFIDADGDGEPDTFSSGSSHTLKMFYLERGGSASDMSVYFSLQEKLYDEILKLDQNGEPIEDVEFALYAVYRKSQDTVYNALELSSANDVKNEVANWSETTWAANLVKLNLTTCEDGTARFERSDNGNPMNFYDLYKIYGVEYYILREIGRPEGYKPISEDIILRCNIETSMLEVENVWATGAVTNFNIYMEALGAVYYGDWDGDTTVALTQKVPDNSAQHGLVLTVPLIENPIAAEDSSKWLALYGSNLYGFSAIKPDGAGSEAMIKTMLSAVLRQIYDPNSPVWSLEWSENNNRIQGIISDLPGVPSRYRVVNEDGDLQSVYTIIEPEALEALGIDTTLSNGEKISGIEKYIRELIEAGYTEEDAYELTAEKILGTAVSGKSGGSGYNIISTSTFQREYKSRIYIPNEKRMLYVRKVDEYGNYINGAEFTLYDGAAAIASGKTATVNGIDGVLIFASMQEYENTDGYAYVQWGDYGKRYILKETKAPPGYDANNTDVNIVVGNMSIYADAGAAGDGVTVRSSPGKLTQTMVRYATDGDVNVTLRDITITLETKPSGVTASWDDVQWSDDAGKLNLHYGTSDKALLTDYSSHDAGGKPFFEIDEGWARVRVAQNYGAHAEERSSSIARETNIEEETGSSDITELFTLVNSVVFTDKNLINNPRILGGRKYISGTADEKPLTGEYSFNIEPLYGIYEGDNAEITGKKDAAEIPFFADMNLESYGYSYTAIPENYTDESQVEAVIVSNNDTGGFSFPPILYNEDDDNDWTYFYKITEVIPDSGNSTGVIYDEGVYIAKVHVYEHVYVNEEGANEYVLDTTAEYFKYASVEEFEADLADGELNAYEEVTDFAVFVNRMYGSITIYKVDGSGSALAGAEFTITGNGQEAAQTTSLAKIVYIEKDEDGNYDPAYNAYTGRYAVGGTRYVVHKDADGNPYYLTALTEEEIKAYESGTLDAAVVAMAEFSGLSLNTGYSISETVVPDGYLQTSKLEALKNISLPVTNDNGATYSYDVIYTVTNHKKLVLASTGSAGALCMVTFGAIITFFAAYIIMCRRRRKRE